jgi:FemAB-related protein (PEP-CTERM system-associated)
VLSFFFRDEVLPYYAGGGSTARQLGAFDFMYWEVMSRAATHRDVRLFDFGRSKFGTGAFAFKKNWGFSPHPLSYQYWLREGHSIPDHNPLNPKYRVFIESWKRLPLPLANLIGPTVSRGIG